MALSKQEQKRQEQEEKSRDEAQVLYLMEKYRVSRRLAETAVQNGKYGVVDAETGLKSILERRAQVKKDQEKITRTGEKLASQGGRGHWFATDRKLKTVAAIVAFILVVSWTAQWVAYALPYWKGDQYHVAGLFQACGNTDLVYNKTSTMLEPGPLYPWKCEPVDDYADRFIASLDKYSQYPPAQAIQKDAKEGKSLIVVSRWIEASSTAADMYFGLFSLYLIVYPKMDDRINSRNWYIAVAGVSLAPALCIIDSVLTFNNFQKLGIGYFNFDRQTSFYFSGDAIWVGTALDVVLQYWFLYWASTYQYKLSKAVREKEEREYEAAKAAAAAAAASSGATEEIPLQEIPLKDVAQRV
ncbi:hypothetical protein HDU79_007244 [Rhizoclosmatium sp. JEL0117]|nr:hypothetical protein HDU79_007244 [Rhizoclosmatium sp. JEL0117]